MGLFSKPNPQLGYHLFLGTHAVLCKGPIDFISRIRGSGKTLWQGYSEGGEIFIDAVDAYGGQFDGEGGVLGWLDIMMGGADQQKNRYLQGALGTTKIPAYRGVVSVVQKQMYLGVTRYPKPMQYLCTRTDVQGDGEEQWYIQKARIGAEIDGPASVYFALDNSGSMLNVTSNGKTRLENQGDAIKAAIDLLLEGAAQHRIDVAISLYGSATATRTTIIRRQIDGSAVAELHDFIDAAVGDMATYWPAGLMDAESFFAESGPGKHIVIFTTDGEPANTGYTAAQVAESAQAMTSALSASVYAMNIDLPDTSWTAYVDTTPRDGVPVVSGGDPEQLLAVIRAALMHPDMNPAHILRELDTSKYYGMRHPVDDIDDAAFTAAADKLYLEGMGFSYLWGFSGESSVNDFSNIICRHIDAIHAVSFQTGKLFLKLIRDDYDPDTLPVFDQSNIVRVLDAHCTAPHELVNKVTGTYWDPSVGKIRSISAVNPAAINGGTPVNAITEDFTGFSSARICALAIARELRARGSQAWTFEIEVQRVGEKVDFGEPVKLNLPGYNAHNLIMRVMDIQLMDTDDATIKLILSQDIYALPTVPVVIQTPGYVPPSQVPQPAAPRIAMELPYWALIQREGQAAIDAALVADPGLGFIGVAAGQPDGVTGADFYVNPGAGYLSLGSFSFSGFTTVPAGLDRFEDTIEVASPLDLFGVDVGEIGIINGELVACTAIDLEVDPPVITLARGILDSAPKEHAPGDKIIWWGETYNTDEVQYNSDDEDEVSVKILTRTGSSAMALSAAPADAVQLNARAVRPYPPANVQINGEYWPDGVADSVVITWAHRNKHSAQVNGWFDDSVDPPVGLTYTLAIRDSFNELIYVEGGIEGTTTEVDAAELIGYSTLYISVEAVLDGISSYPFEHVVAYENNTVEMDFTDSYTPPDGDDIILQFEED